MAITAVARRCAAASMACYGLYWLRAPLFRSDPSRTMKLEISVIVLQRSRCLWLLKSRARPQEWLWSGFAIGKSACLPHRGVQRAPTRAEASPPLVSMRHPIRPPGLCGRAAVAQNETQDSYLDAGRRFCNQSQRYHRYAVKPAEQEAYTKNQ